MGNKHLAGRLVSIAARFWRGLYFCGIQNIIGVSKIKRYSWQYKWWKNAANA